MMSYCKEYSKVATSSMIVTRVPLFFSKCASIHPCLENSDDALATKLCKTEMIKITINIDFCIWVTMFLNLQELLLGALIFILKYTSTHPILGDSNDTGCL